MKGTQAVLPKSFLFYLPLLKDSKFSPTEGLSRSSSNPAPKHIAGRTGTCPSSMSCPNICEAIQITSIAKKQHKCRCQSVTLVRKPVSSEFPSLPDQINEECLLCNVESQESLSLADTSNLVLGTALVADAAVLWLRGILSLPGIMLPVPVQGKNEQSIEQLLLCRKNTSTCATSMSCQSCQLMLPSCSNPVHIDHQY